MHVKLSAKTILWLRAGISASCTATLPESLGFMVPWPHSPPTLPLPPYNYSTIVRCYISHGSFEWPCLGPEGHEGFQVSSPVTFSDDLRLTVYRYAVSKGAAFIRARLQQDASKPVLEAIPARINKQPLHPLAALRQGRSQQRNFSTAVRRIISAASGPARVARPAPAASIRVALSRTTHAPFASPLRPNLTGGALPRASGGYSLGGGVRHFSHTPAAQAQVLHNVSAAMRAFCVNGFKAQYDGVDTKTGNKRFRAVTVAQEKAISSFRSAKANSKGTTLEFCIAPTVTAVSPLDAAENTIDTEVLSGLASDFSRSLASLSLVHADLKRLSALGRLPISQPNPHTLRVRFPGCDGRLVNSLCDELGIRRGIVKEDPEWDADEGDKDVGMALLFPWAPSKPASEFSDDAALMDGKTYFSRPRTVGPAESLEWQSMLTRSPPSVPAAKTSSGSEASFELLVPSQEEGTDERNPWLEYSTVSGNGSSAGFEALRESDLESNEDCGPFEGYDLTRTETARQASYEPVNRSPQSFADYEGTEGILRFLEVCEGSARR